MSKKDPAKRERRETAVKMPDGQEREEADWALEAIENMIYSNYEINAGTTRKDSPPFPEAAGKCKSR
jgi:hypothetical protein